MGSVTTLFQKVIDEAIWRALMKEKNFNATTWTEKLWATSEKPTIKTYEGTI